MERKLLDEVGAATGTWVGPGRACADLPTTFRRQALWWRVVHALAESFGARSCVLERRLGGCDWVAHHPYCPDEPRSLPGTTEIEAALETGWDVPPAQDAAGPEVVLLPVWEHGEVAAVLRVALDTPPDAATRRTLEGFASAVGQRLTERSWALQAGLVQDVSVRLAAVDALAAGAAAALDALVDALHASGGVLFHVHRGRMMPLADHGEHARARRLALGAGTPYPRGLAWRVVLEGRPEFTRDYANDPQALLDLPTDPSVWIVPLARKQRARFVLALTFPDARRPATGERRVLEAALPVLAGMLNALQDTEAQERLAELQLRLPEVPAVALYPHVLDAAVDSVPGAELGILLDRRAGEDEFTVRSTIGPGFEPLQGLRVAVTSAQAWYDPEGRSWGDAAPRLAVHDPRALPRRLRSVGMDRATIQRVQADKLKADICIPLRVDGDVRVVLVLGATSRSGALGRDSLRIARLMAAAAASTLQVAFDRDAARRDASTDPLTGLTNRRGAEAELARALARAARNDEALSLSVLDLGGFKDLNDALGHAQGDQALTRVARALVGTTRAGDVVARWGGDEFVAILPRQSARDAHATAHRLARVVGGIEIAGQRLRAHVGTSSFPTDAIAAEALVRVADERMYDAKFADAAV